MKKILLLMIGAIVALTSCQKDLDLEANGSSGEMVSVTVSAVMEGTSATTRAIADNGTGATIDRCIMEVYSNGELYKRVIETPNVLSDGTRSVTFDLRLVSSQEYNFLFWADYSDSTDEDNYYDTDSYDADDTYLGLTAITADYNSYVGNDEKRDAFFGNILGETITSSIVLDVTLRRPFGQLNVSTLLTDVPKVMYPATVQITSKTPLYNTFNVSTKEAWAEGEGDVTFSWDADADAIDYVTNYEYKGEAMHLSTDYIFAPYYDDEVKQQLVDFVMEFFDATGTSITTNDNFINIPIQRNYRTNVTGELLTKQGTINVTIDPIFYTPDIEVDVTEVASLEKANEAIANATSDITIVFTSETELNSSSDSSDSGSNFINIPATFGSDEGESANVETITLDLSVVNISGNEISVGYEKNTDNKSTYSGTVVVIVPDNIIDADDIKDTFNILMPEAHVIFYGTTGTVIAETSGTTFVVDAEASITTLTINGGNVEIYGTVDTIEVSKDNKDEGTIKVFNRASLTTVGELYGYTIIYYDPSDPIQNITSGQSYNEDEFETAIADANSGDIIELATGVYSVQSTTNSSSSITNNTTVIQKSLTIKGAQAGISALNSSRSIDNIENESVITCAFSAVGIAGAEITFDGVYFMGSSDDKTSLYKLQIDYIAKLEMTNCIANNIQQHFLYSNHNDELKEEVVITNNKFVGSVESGSTDNDTHIFIYNVKSMTVTNNYLGDTSRGVNLTISAFVDAYDTNHTQATIQGNTFANLTYYGVQTSYYPYGKIIIEDNIFSNIECGEDGEEEGAINIRGYQPSGGDGVLEYEYEITNNTFTDVASVFLTRLYSLTDSSGLEIGDDKVVIEGNTINNFTNWILRCDDDKDYNGTIDLSDNDISYTGDFADYLYLLGDAKVKYDGVEYSYVYPVYNTTTGDGYETLTEAIEAADDGDTIYVGAGEYTTAITIDKELTIQGPNAGVAGYSDERVEEAKFTTNSISFKSNNVTLDGIALDGATMSMNYELENITLKNLSVENIGYYFCRNTSATGDITNLVVEDSKFYNVYSSSGEPFVFFLYNLVSAEFNNNIFDEIDKHALNIQLSPNATSLAIRNNTFTNCTSAAIQLANQNAGKIDIDNNTINNCYTAFNIYAWKSVGTFAAQIDVTNNNVSDVHTFACIGNADYVNSAGVPEPFTEGAYVTFEDNTITVDYYSGIYYAYILSDFYSYDGVVTFTNNDVSGGRSGVYNTWANILSTKYAFYTDGHECTKVNIDGVLYQPSSNGLYLEECSAVE